MLLTLAARESKLSQAQVAEVIELLEEHQIFRVETTWVATSGDLDQTTSLRGMDKTDFFTKEIDRLLLEGKCRAAVHSAKDLPDPLPEGLQIVAITEGIDPRDSLVLREGDTLESLSSKSLIATSSERREEAVRELREDLKFVDIRGSVDKRLEKLHSGEVDGLVVAEAALLRLGLSHLNRLYLPGETAPYQGKLAILARKDDEEAERFFDCIDARPRALYTGLELPAGLAYKRVTHCPFIAIEPRPKEEIKASLKELGAYTHILFTSKSSAAIFLKHADLRDVTQQSILAVGRSTAKYLRDHGVEVDHVANEESSEGIIALLQTMKLKNAYLFWPHSALSRSVILDYLREQHIRHKDSIYYDTRLISPEEPPELGEFDEVIFTSPSTVDGFLQCYKELPSDLTLTPIGPVTAAKLLECG